MVTPPIKEKKQEQPHTSISNGKENLRSFAKYGQRRNNNGRNQHQHLQQRPDTKPAPSPIAFKLEYSQSAAQSIQQQH
tara:strand:+ start:1366 stop:1599 length:234 start_codon:yes stop_codon:yes gene_type:complete